MTRRRRPTRKCDSCARGTRSVTGYCTDHRPADAIPFVHRVPGDSISFAGLTFTSSQARRLADALHDALDEGHI
ncbi:hypothetical protein SAMN04488550_1176 [Gordonia malaquae]|uniref:Uncharacterized protein n=1 Tax=Gordonia malaquae NBRC 108250 TaxID=1223542 RepID=M3VC02_GORML|nr:hypothetical protein [Gordonia malaquae]GAC81158.1 hypothetical protein GM1_029_00610 [Gordonia malaquae NBRC 108250]SEC02141.1 hypothetical protein SAMN04488550_1176 [Gordonia malaquae]